MNVFLISAGILSAVVAILHIGCIYFGAPWYRFFGAGEKMVVLAEKGSIQATLITSGIVLVLSIWSLYAFSAAGIIVRLPLLRLALILITSIYLAMFVAYIDLSSTSDSPLTQGKAFLFFLKIYI